MSWNGNQHELSESGVAVVERDDPVDSAGVFASLLDAYQGQGYEHGYRRGVADVLASMLALTEDYLHQQSLTDPTLRQALYGFEAYVERHVLQGKNDAGFVSEGLGI